jgi:hypothetical protein
VTATTYRILDTIADSFDPLLAVIALACPFLRKQRVLRPAILYYLSAGAAIGFVYLVRAIDSRQQIWGSFGLDFSSHSAFAASLAISIGAFNRRWAAPVAVAVALYFCLELVMRYHGPLDILSSATAAALAALLLHAVTVRVSR